MFCKKGVLRNFAKLTGKHLWQSLFCNTVAESLQFIKEDTLHRGFPVNVAKFLRTPFLTKHLRWLLLTDHSAYCQFSDRLKLNIFLTLNCCQSLYLTTSLDFWLMVSHTFRSLAFQKCSKAKLLSTRQKQSSWGGEGGRLPWHILLYEIWWLFLKFICDLYSEIFFQNSNWFLQFQHFFKTSVILFVFLLFKKWIYPWQY